MYGPGKLPDRASVRSGELQAGGTSMGLVLVYVWLEYSDDPLKGHPGQLAYTL
jgi:hypothetical protein